MNSSLETFTPSFFKRLQQLKIRTRRTFLGSRQGGHVSLRRGHGLEFSDFRPYTPGDDYRHIDWGVYGRTDRLYVRQFREEQDLNVIVLLDTSNSMAFPPAENKFETARDLALALGYIALTDGDTVTFSLLGQRNTPRYIGPRCLHQAASLISQCKPGGTFDFVNELRAAVVRQKLPGRCFLISDFFFDLEKQYAAIDLLRAKNFETSVIQVMAPSELRLDLKSTEVVIDSETDEMIDLTLNDESATEYARQLADHVEALEKYCFQNEIAHLLVSSEESVADVILTRLPQLGILK